MSTLGVGRIVIYTLSKADADAVNRRRDDFTAFSRIVTATPGEQGEPGRSGHQAHVGNHAREGDICTALVVRVFDRAGNRANLQVLLDGNDSFWATSVPMGEGPGCWSWPERD